MQTSSEEKPIFTGPISNSCMASAAVRKTKAIVIFRRLVLELKSFSSCVSSQPITAPSSSEQHDLEQRIDQDRHQVERADVHRLRDAEGDGEHDEADRVVQRDDRQQDVDQRALRLILPDDHQRGGRGRRRSDGAKGDGLRNGERVRERGDGDERDVDEQRRGQRLQHTDDSGLFAGMLQRGHTELVADGERDEAQRDLRYERQMLDIFIACEAQPVEAKTAEAVRPDQHAGDQIGRHRGQLERLEHARHQKTRENCDGKRQ